MGGLAEKKERQIQELIIRMDRNNTIIQKLSKKLNSYTCEPHDSSCFEKLYTLKRGFKLFDNHQSRIMALLKSKPVLTTELDADIKGHIKRFGELEKDMAAYLLATNQYF
ncbi:hypothetical protein [Flagellimonas sp. S3867]|uniref:hypothetical protein n=1 Tax=Flagellimonas sp. S3867 TaxID=2768063 RepID=UPI001688E8A0|nr:hypothetical protein [Flagellimonas sp. S3867]